MKPVWVLTLVAALVAAVSALSWRLGYRTAAAVPTETERADTLIVKDTVTVECPVPVLTTVIDTILVVCPDIIVIRDTVYARLPRERKEYSGKDFRAVVSGYRPSLDLIQVFPETKTVIRTVSAPSRKNPHWSVGIQAGYGLTFRDNRITSAPYIGAGISYSLIEW